VHRFHAITHLAADPTPSHLAELGALIVVALAVAFLFTRVSPTTTFVVGMGAEAFSGNWKYVHIPLGIDRILFVLGIVILIVGSARLGFERRLVLRPAHLLLLAVEAYAVCSAIAVHTFGTSLGFYALLDRLGALPFLMFTLAPLLFATKSQRDRLLIMMVALGLYLGATAFFEVVGPHSLVYPRFIANQAIGITQGRARGPFLASDADSLALFICGALAAVALVTWKNLMARVLCGVVILLDAVGIFLTLTRSSWIGTCLGVITVMLVDRRLRRLLVPTLAISALAIAAALSIPSIDHKVQGRVSQQSSIWDRKNTDDAALRLLEAHPVFGIGWETFVTTGPSALRQADTYPLTGVGLEVHNVFLSHLTELGLLGGSLWILAYVSILGRGIFRRGPPELYPWRLALIAYGVMFTSVALFVPLSYPLPNMMLWVVAGIVSMDYFSKPRVPRQWEIGAGRRSRPATEVPDGSPDEGWQLVRA
jgi:O-antigen ligase